MANGRKTKKIKKSESKTKSDNKNKETDVEVKKEQYATIVHFVTQVAPPMIGLSGEKSPYCSRIVELFKQKYELCKDKPNGKEEFNKLVEDWGKQWLGGSSISDSQYFIDWWEHSYNYRHTVEVEDETTGKIKEEVVITPTPLDDNYNFLSEDKILEVLGKLRNVKEYAYILHDSDYIDVDSEEELPSYYEYAPRDSQGRILKNPHWHIAIRFKRSLSINRIAKYFGFEGREGFFKIVKPQKEATYDDCWFDTVEYLTHESPKEIDAGKHRYEDSLVKANFDWRDFLDSYIKSSLLTSHKDMIKRQVQAKGLTLYRAAKLYTGMKSYINSLNDLPRLRSNYLINIAEKPQSLINMYIFGLGGTGKDIISDWLAFFLKYGEEALNFDSIKGGFDTLEYSFPITSTTLGFTGYDGQTSVIYSDKRVIDLIHIFSDRTVVLSHFDPYPKDTLTNVKYGSVRAVCRYQIVSDIEEDWGNPNHHHDFLTGLAGEYKDWRTGEMRPAEDKSQTYRRFPIVIRCTENGYTLLLNNHWLSNGINRDFFTYSETHYYGIPNRILKCGKSPKEINNIMYKFLKPIIDAVHYFEENYFKASIDYDTTFVGMSEIEAIDYKLENDIDFTGDNKHILIKYSNSVNEKLNDISYRLNEISESLKLAENGIAEHEKLLNDSNLDKSNIDYCNNRIAYYIDSETSLKSERNSLLEERNSLDIKLKKVNDFLYRSSEKVKKDNEMKKACLEFKELGKSYYSLVINNKDSIKAESYFDNFLPVLNYVPNTTILVGKFPVGIKLSISDLFVVSRADSFNEHRDILKNYMKSFEELESKGDIKKSENFDIYKGYYQITHKLLTLF